MDDTKKRVNFKFTPGSNCFDYSASIDVKSNFEQTNPFECFFTLLGFTLIENRNKNCNSILPPICNFQSL